MADTQMEQTLPTSRPPDKVQFDLMRKALDELISTVENTGGVIIENGLAHPLADEEWVDVGEAYMSACLAVGRTPMVSDSSDYEDWGDDEEVDYESC